VIERRFRVNREEREIAALCWGEAGQLPVIALHGWLDNASSFSLLAPLLAGCHVVALDMAGHGHSDQRSADGEYNIWNDLPDILAVADELGWSEFSLMGHSRGAIVSTLLASTCPQRVSRLLLLDAWLPQVVSAADFTRQLAEWLQLQEQQRQPAQMPRVFETLETAVALRQKSGLEAAAAKLIAERNLKACEGGWCWSTDPRVRGASAFKLTADHTAAILEQLTMPTLLLMAEGGLGSAQVREKYVGDMPDLEYETIPGGHHFHMEEPLQPLAQRISKFLTEGPD